MALMFVAGTILVSSSSLMAPWLQNLANYPVETAGLIMAPRGIGTMMAMMSGGRLVGRLDPRKVMAVGIALSREYCAGGGLPAGRGVNRSGWWLAYRSLSSGSARCIQS
jgi:MFS family permease